MFPLHQLNELHFASFYAGCKSTSLALPSFISHHQSRRSLGRQNALYIKSIAFNFSFLITSSTK